MTDKKIPLTSETTSTTKSVTQLVYLGKKNPKVVELNDFKVKFTPNTATDVPVDIATVLLEKAGNIFISPGGVAAPAIDYESDNSIEERKNEAKRKKKLKKDTSK